MFLLLAVGMINLSGNSDLELVAKFERNMQLDSVWHGSDWQKFPKPVDDHS